MDQSRTPYADAVKAYAAKEFLRLGVPGHQVSARSHPQLVDFFGIDALRHDVQTLIEGIDIGTHPTALTESEQLAALAWGAKRTWFLTNGASMGNMMACLALRAIGDHIVLQRSVHSSVIDGLAFSGLSADFVFPSVDKHLGIANGITPDGLETVLAVNPSACATYVITPSYFGAVADVAGLARVAHAHGIPLVVDEAWGAHFGFHPDLPTNANRLGADIVISSTHKLSGSLSQSAMLHLSDGPFADLLEPLLERAFRSLQSTSVNSLLLASLDIARSTMATQGHSLIGKTIDAVSRISAGIKAVDRFADMAQDIMAYSDVVAIDPVRISINTQVGGISGYEARSILFKKDKIHCELATGSALLLLVGAGVDPDTDRILRALHELPHAPADVPAVFDLPTPGPMVMTVRNAYFAKTEIVPASLAVGRTSGDSVAAYPPGIPNLLPGELITKETIDFLQATAQAPFGHLRGGSSEDLSTLRVVVD